MYVSSHHNNHYGLNVCLATKVGAIVAGQTSVKAPEREAFERHLPSDVNIVSCHSLHGPTISPFGQALVDSSYTHSSTYTANHKLQILIQHRAPDWALTLVENILRPFGSRYVYLSYEDHDLVTANTQAVTHAAFLRYLNQSFLIFMCLIGVGTAWVQPGRVLRHIHGSTDNTSAALRM